MSFIRLFPLSAIKTITVCFILRPLSFSPVGEMQVTLLLS